MKVKQDDYQSVSALLISGHWYNMTPGSFRLVSEDEIPVGDALHPVDCYGFEYNHRAKGEGRMEVRDDQILSIQYTGSAKYALKAKQL
jgi:hypothetical protein